MIRYFAYYSFGGYEDLYLGKHSDREQYHYYLPLLGRTRDKLDKSPDNEALKAEVARLEKYPLIRHQGDDAEASLPQGAAFATSHGGCSLLYRRHGAEFVLTIKNLLPDDYDEMGGGTRPNPFALQLVADGDDVSLLGALTHRLLSPDAKTYRKQLGNMFDYDAVSNGLRFHLQDMNRLLDGLRDWNVTGIDTNADVPVLVVAEGFSRENAVKEQELRQLSIGSTFDANGRRLDGRRISVQAEEPAHNDVSQVAEEQISLTEHKRICALYEQKLRRQEQALDDQRAKFTMIAVGAAVAAFILAKLI